MTTCRNCRYWGRYVDGIYCYHVRATCDAPKTSFTYDNDTCENWEQRPGEPLGTGLSKWWWHPTLFDAASIIHDLRYDALEPGESTADIDREWHRNALDLADSWYMRRMADIGYLLIRLYGRVRG